MVVLILERSEQRTYTLQAMCASCGAKTKGSKIKMAIYHLSAQVIKRSNGHSAVAASAYRAGEKLIDERTGEIHDYTKKEQVGYSEILVPENVGAWAHDRQSLWNATELAEKRKDAQLAREINIAIPVELTAEQGRELVRDYAKENFVDKGMIADICIHGEGTQNPHAHIMLTMREATENGLGKKNRDWNDKNNIELWRESWAHNCNKSFQREGLNISIDHRSYERQGIDKVAGIHLGKTASNLEKKGIETDRGNLNRAIKDENIHLENAKKELAEITKQIEAIAERQNQQKEQPVKAEISLFNKDKPVYTNEYQAKTAFHSRMTKESETYRQEKEQIADTVTRLNLSGELSEDMFLNAERAQGEIIKKTEDSILKLETKITKLENHLQKNYTGIRGVFGSVSDIFMEGGIGGKKEITEQLNDSQKTLAELKTQLSTAYENQQEARQSAKSVYKHEREYLFSDENHSLEKYRDEQTKKNREEARQRKQAQLEREQAIEKEKKQVSAQVVQEIKGQKFTTQEIIKLVDLPTEKQKMFLSMPQDERKEYAKALVSNDLQKIMIEAQKKRDAENIIDRNALAKEYDNFLRQTTGASISSRERSVKELMMQHDMAPNQREFREAIREQMNGKNRGMER